MVSPDTTAEPEAPMDVDPFSGATWCIDPPSRGSTPVAEWAVCRQISEVRTVCVRSASTDLCGGCRVTGIPTATRSPAWFRSLANSNPNRERRPKIGLAKSALACAAKHRRVIAYELLERNRRFPAYALDGAGDFRRRAAFVIAVQVQDLVHLPGLHAHAQHPLPRRFLRHIDKPDGAPEHLREPLRDFGMRERLGPGDGVALPLVAGFGQHVRRHRRNVRHIHRAELHHAGRSVERAPRLYAAGVAQEILEEPVGPQHRERQPRIFQFPLSLAVLPPEEERRLQAGAIG